MEMSVKNMAGSIPEHIGFRCKREGHPLSETKMARHFMQDGNTEFHTAKLV